MKIGIVEGALYLRAKKQFFFFYVAQFSFGLDNIWVQEMSTEFTECGFRKNRLEESHTVPKGVRVSQMKTLNIFFYFFCHGRYGVLIRDSYPDVRAFSFTVTRRFSFTMASTAAMPSGVTTRCA